MLSQEIQFFIRIKDGIVEQIGRTCIQHPGIKFTGKGIKWFEDNKKAEELGERSMRRVDKRIELLKKFQDEMDRRTEIEKKAEALICAGEFKEATELLQNLDDEIIKGIAKELDEFDSKYPEDEAEELTDCMDELLTHTGRDVTQALDEYYAQIVKKVAEDCKDNTTVQELRKDHPELDFVDDEELEEILELAKRNRLKCT